MGLNYDAIASQAIYDYDDCDDGDPAFSDDREDHSPKKMTILKKKGMSFDGIIGYDELKANMISIVMMIKKAKKTKNFDKLPHGILLTGKFGNGKTLFARWLLEHCGTKVFIFSQNGSDKVSQIHKLYAKARKAAPSIVFIDEISTLIWNDSNFKEALLTEMDGAREFSGVITLGCGADINNGDGLFRAGRFDLQFKVGFPSFETRKKMLFYMGKDLFAEDVDYDALANSTSGMSCADVTGMVRLASVLSGAKEHDKIDMEDALMGIQAERSQIEISSESDSRFGGPDAIGGASHEIGHLILSLASEGAATPYIAIIHDSRSEVGGEVDMGFSHDCEGKPDFTSKKDVINRLALMMAGMAGEEFGIGRKSISGGSDLMAAQSMLLNLVDCGNCFGFSHFHNYLTENQAEKKEDNFLGFYRHMLKKAYRKAMRTLRKNRKAFFILRARILQKGYLCHNDWKDVKIRKTLF